MSQPLLSWIGSVALAGCGSLAAAEPPTRPNVLFIIADDLAAGRLGCYGDATAVTPAIDQLARQGVRFTHAYAASTVCTPSRKSFLTGLAIQRVGADNSVFMQANPTCMTMPRWFREHGYQTVRIGKVEHTPEYAGPEDWDVSLDAAIPSGAKSTTYHDATHKVLGQGLVLPDDVPTRDQLRARGFERFVTKDWDRRRPFFFALGFHSPHMPWESQEKHHHLHPVERMRLTVAPPDVTPMTKPPGYQQWMLAQLHGPSGGDGLSRVGRDDPSAYNRGIPEATQREMVRDYASAVTMMDEALGGVMRCLDQQGLASSTIVVFTADQGYFLGYRGMWSKHYLYPEVLSAPIIVRYPDMPRTGVQADGIVELLDIFPTLAELAGLPQPPGLDGASFVPLLVDPAREGKAAAYAEGIMYGGYAVTTRDGMFLDWHEGPAMIRAIGGNDPKSLSVLDRVIDLSHLRGDLTIHLDGPQRWVDLAGRIEASREFYRLDQDPDAWVDRSQDPACQAEIRRHAALEQAYFAHHGTSKP